MNSQRSLPLLPYTNLVNTFSRIAYSLISAFTASTCFAEVSRTEAEATIERGVNYFHSLSNRGGYVYFVTPDLSRRWGEGVLDENTIEVQPPGTPAVGMAFLRAYKATGSSIALKAARDAAHALSIGQNDRGGWQHTIRFDRPTGDMVSFDDDQTQSAISFLMALDQEVDDPELTAAIDKALILMKESQLENGGWPHRHPSQGDYHDFATFNDEGINDCIRVMLEAHQYYGGVDVESVLLKSGRFLMLSQLPPPQPGWAQQYNEFLQPAWARSFEPPSVCPSVTINNINTLLDLYVRLGRNEYLEPIPDSLKWIESIRLPNGKWARFIELHTGKALYYDRGRIRVDSLEELSEERRLGYGYQVELQGRLESVKQRYQQIMELGREAHLAMSERSPLAGELERKISKLSSSVSAIIDSQNSDGAWITKNDQFKKRSPGQLWQGEYEILDRVSSRVFIENIDTLCEYIRLLDSRTE